MRATLFEGLVSRLCLGLLFSPVAAGGTAREPMGAQVLDQCGGPWYGGLIGVADPGDGSVWWIQVMDQCGVAW